MGRRKQLCIISTSDSSDDEELTENQEQLETQSDQSSFHGNKSNNPKSPHHELPTNEHHREQGTQKKVRGPTQKAVTWNMKKSKKILVTFYKSGKPVGVEGNELTQYLGTLVRMAKHAEIEYSDWRKVLMHTKEDMYALVKANKCY